MEGVQTGRKGTLDHFHPRKHVRGRKKRDDLKFFRRRGILSNSLKKKREW